MKKTIGVLVFVLFCFTTAAPAAHAQVYYQNYQAQSKEAQIAYLQGVIAQLLAQLAQRDGVRAYTYQHTYQTGNTYGPYYGQVRGASYSTSDIRVDTSFAHLSNGDVELNGTVDLRGATNAYVWFEYGDDDDFGYTTSKRYVTRDTKFSADLDDLEEDEYFYYRAVGESSSGGRDYGTTRSFYVGDYSGSSRSDDDEPEATTDDAEDVEENSAELHGEVDMNDFNNGLVFFVYGEDEDQIDDVDREDRYRDIDEDGEDLQKIIVDSDLDGDRSYWRDVYGLDDNTDHYFRICVEYEDDDDDDVLECGSVEHFETD